MTDLGLKSARDLLCLFLLTCFGDEKPNASSGCKEFENADNSTSVFCHSQGVVGSWINARNYEAVHTFAFSDYAKINPYLTIVLNRVKIENLIIDQTSQSLVRPFDFKAEFPSQKTLKYLTITNSFEVNTWIPRKFNNLQGVHIESSTFSNYNWTSTIVDSLTSQSTRWLSFIDCGLKLIESKTFENVPKLRALSLSRNQIKDFHNEWFTTPMNDLWSLDLSYNHLESIHAKAMWHLGKLRRLMLNNNRLVMKDIKPVLQSVPLEELWVCGNTRNRRIGKHKSDVESASVRIELFDGKGPSNLIGGNC